MEMLALRSLDTGLHACLKQMKKTDLDHMRKQLKVSGMSQLNKAALAEGLTEKIPENIKAPLRLLDKKRFQLLKKIVRADGFLKVTLYSEQLFQFQSLGLAFEAVYQGEVGLFMPPEVRDSFNHLNEIEVMQVIKRNDEWIRLTNGMLYFYGAMKTLPLVSKLEALTGTTVDPGPFFDVMWLASDYYQQVHIKRGYIEDFRVDGAEVLMAQETKEALDFYPFTKQQLLKAGEDGYEEVAPPLKKLLDFLQSNYEMAKIDVLDLRDVLLTSFKQGVSLADLMDDLSQGFEFPTKAVSKKVNRLLVDAYNNTRLWILKGYKPNEIGETIEVPTLSESSDKTNPDQYINEYRDVGRNDPCPCGSGKKFKKCCGKR